jgi:ABC-2 type transport system permease protein
MPFAQIFLLGYGVSLDLKHVPICTFDREASQNSQVLLDHFQASAYFTTARNVHTYPDLSKAIDRADCKLGLVIPPDFSERLNDAGSSSVQVILDATDDNTATIAFSYATAVLNNYSSDLRIAWSARNGQELRMISPMSIKSRVWFNEDLESRNFIIPGVVATIMALVGAQLTSLTIAREWERGTMELLVSTPVEPMELMLGKLMPYFLIGMVDACICLALAVFWFDVPYRGTLAALFVTTGLFLTVVLCIGYTISVTIRSQVGASQVALLLTMLPTTLLSGFAFPIDQMPAAVQAVTRVVSARYYVTILKALFLKGASWQELLAPTLYLVLYAAIMVFLAARAFRKTLD